MQVPTALSNMEGIAEDAYDQALAGNFAGVRTDATTLQTAWQGFRDQALADGAAAPDLASMDDAIASLVTVSVDATDSIVLARTANAVSAPMDELYGLYDPTVPPEVLVLDYLGREVVLDAKQADFSGATAHVDAVDAAWGVLRPSLVSTGGTAEAADYDASLALLRADITAADAIRLETDAQAGLELVDAMEGVFATAEQPD